MQPVYSAFLDESSALRSENRQEYLVCAAIVPQESAEEIREALLPLRLKGQIKLHWSDEDEFRRRKIVSTIAELTPMTAVVTHISQPQKKTEHFRRKCLETIYHELCRMGIHQLTCESRTESQNKKDIAHLLTLRQRKWVLDQFDISHCRGGDDPLLWIPDVFLGAINARHKGVTEHYEALKDFVVYDAATESSLLNSERP